MTSKRSKTPFYAILDNYWLTHLRASGVAVVITSAPTLLSSGHIPLQNHLLTSANEIDHVEYGRPLVMWFNILVDFNQSLLVLHATFRADNIASETYFESYVMSTIWTCSSHRAFQIENIATGLWK